jgi:Uma2 family endonuclease
MICYNANMTLAVEQSLDTPQPHRFSREEYYQMFEMGMFRDRRVELIDGEIIDMPAMKDLHAVAVGLVQKSLLLTFPDAWVRCQLPVSFLEASEPEPDFSVVRGDPRDYKGKGHPSDALLIVEISDSTLRFDRGKKATVYARAGIADYWIVNLVESCVEVRRSPVQDRAAPLGWRYASTEIVKPGSFLSPLARPSAPIEVKDILP